MNAEGFRARLYSSLSYMCYLNYANSPSYQSSEQLISLVYNNTLLVRIFAGLNFRDFRDCKKIAKLKTHGKKLSQKINAAKFNTLL